MKVYLQLIFLTITLLFFGCKKSVKEKVTDKTEKVVELEQTKNSSQNPIAKKKKTEISKHYERLYVIAKSGLNYRDSPKGKVLGKFPLNTQLKIIEYTKIAEKVKDGEKFITGEWLGVEKEKDTVYVFNGFLASSSISSDIKLYQASSFLNISETYFHNTTSENSKRDKNLIITENNLSKDQIRLTSNQRKKFLELTDISESDKIFVYQIGKDNIAEYEIKDLSVSAHTNVYFSGANYEKSEFDYEFGFELKSTNGGFAFIGKNNPFQTGKLTPIIWKEIDGKEFPKKFNANIILDHRKRWLNGFEPEKSFKFSNNNLVYYIQNLKKDNRFHRYMVVIDSRTRKIIFENVQIDSEGTYLVPLTTETQKNDYENQWTGELFKNKSSVIFGFLGYSFSCPSITVLDKTEPSIPILCDNRH